MKELHGQTLSNEIAESDRLAAGIPGQVAAKNILFSKFWAQLKSIFGVNNWTARDYKSSPCIVVYNKQQYILDESVAPLPYTSTDFTTELASNIWLPLGSSITLASQLEAESNTENTKYLTSLRSFQQWYNNIKTYVVIELNTTAKTIAGALNYFNNNVLITKEPTGFVNPDAVNVSYDGATRKVTVTGSTEAYYRGNLITELVSGWVSAAHDIADGSYFLYHNGTSFVWSTTIWPFDVVMIAMAYRDGANFCLRECHGLMAWQTHQELHETLGTYLKSGGDLSGFTLASTTATNRRPRISSTIVRDEDLPTTLPALTTNAYTQLYLSGANTANTVSDATEIIPLLANNPYYNQFTGGNWVQTLFPNNAYGKIFIMAVPVTSDVDCQKKRFIFIQPQTVSTTLATIQAINSSSVNLGHISGTLSEYVFIGEIIVRYAAGNWTLISTAKLIGTKLVQAAIIGGGGGGASIAADLVVDATGFNNNLGATDTNQQLVNQKVNDLPISKRRIADLVNSANVIDIDWNSLNDFNSSNRVAVSANASITYTNATNAQFATFKVLISNLATITFPTGSISGDTRVSSRVFTTTANGAYTISIYKTTTEYEVVISTNPAI